MWFRNFVKWKWKWIIWLVWSGTSLTQVGEKCSGDVFHDSDSHRASQGGGIWRQIVVEDGLCTMAKEQGVLCLKDGRKVWCISENQSISSRIQIFSTSLPTLIGCQS